MSIWRLTNSRAFLRKNHFVWGVLASLGWHLFWTGAVVPVKPRQVYPVLSSQAFFLGSILGPADLSVRASSFPVEPSRSSLRGPDGAASSYFQRSSHALYKPTAPSLSFSPDRDPTTLPVPERPQPFVPEGDEWTMTPAEAPLYMEGVDFSDFAYQFSREDLFPYIDFEILLSPQGRARSIRKVSGSGDPALDLACMRLLKKAVFRFPLATERRVRLRLRIKE